MEYIIEEETRKALEKELQKARQLRQKQVRQQTIQWSEETRKRFEEERERQAKLKIDLVTKEVEEKAKARIEHLMATHDLALAEVGAAHRAAAQFREAEKLKELKRLQNQEQARIRGRNALGRTLQENTAKVGAVEEIRRRKEEVRREEDRKVKEMIEERRKRQPLAPISDSVTNEMQSKRTVPNPKLDQRLAARLQYPGKPPAPVRKKSVQFSSPIKHTKGSPKSKKIELKKSTAKKEPNKVAPIHIREESLSPPLEPRSKTGRFDKEVQKRMKRPVTPERRDHPSVPRHATTRTTKRQTSTSSATSTTGTESQTSKSTSSILGSASEPLTRYYDTAMPRGEKNYVPPKGLAQKEKPSGSPDAWETAEKLSSKAMRELEEKAKKQEELLRKNSERGEVALERARLENKLKVLQAKLSEGAEGYSFLGSGSQEGGLGLEDKPKESASPAGLSGKEDVKRVSPPTDDFLDQFIPIRTDEEVSSDENELTNVPKGSSTRFISPLEDEINKSLKEIEAASSSRRRSKDSGVSEKREDQAPMKSRETYHETMSIIEEGLRQINQIRESNEELPVTTSVLKLQEERARASQQEQEEPKKTHKSSSLSHTSSTSSSSDHRKLKKKSRIGKKIRASPDRVDSGKLPVDTVPSISIVSLDFDTEDSRPPQPDSLNAPTSVGPLSADGTNISQKSKANTTDESPGSNSQGYTSGSTIFETKIKTRLEEPKHHTDHQQKKALHQSKAGSSDRPTTSSKADPITKPKVKVLKKKMSKQLASVNDSTATFSERSSTETPVSKKGKLGPFVDTTPEGPYTSTPDGRMNLKENQSTSDSTVSDGKQLRRLMTKKELLLHTKASELMQRRRESIDALPVSSSSSSNLQIHESSMDLSRSPSTTVNTSAGVAGVSKKSLASSSGSSRTWETILEEQTLIDDSSFASNADSDIARKISQKVLRKLSELNVLSTTTTDESSTILETKINATVGSETTFSQNETTSAGSLNSSDSNSSGNIPDTIHNVSESSNSRLTEGSFEATGVSDTTEEASASAISQSEQSTSSNNQKRSFQESQKDGGNKADSPEASVLEPADLDISAQLKWLRSRFMETDKLDSGSATSIHSDDVDAAGSDGDETVSSPVTSTASSSDNAEEKEVKRLLDSRGGNDISRVSPPVRGDANIQEEMLAVFKSFKEELDGLYIERPPLPSWVV